MIYIKVKIVIEETISQELEVEVNSIETAYDEIRDMYRNCEIVVENGNLIDAQLGIFDDSRQIKEWECIM